MRRLWLLAGLVAGCGWWATPAVAQMTPADCDPPSDPTTEVTVEGGFCVYSLAPGSEERYRQEADALNRDNPCPDSAHWRGYDGSCIAPPGLEDSVVSGEGPAWTRTAQTLWPAGLSLAVAAVLWKVSRRPTAKA